MKFSYIQENNIYLYNKLCVCGRGGGLFCVFKNYGFILSWSPKKN